MLTAIFVAILLVAMTSMFHLTILRWLSGGMARLAMTDQTRVFVIVIVMLLAHIVEISLYAGAYLLAEEVFSLGTFGGLAVDRPLDYLYFSIVTYTSLGLGDVFPGGHLRFLTGIETLNGLLLIAWSGSFIYLAMGRLWPWQTCAAPARTTGRGR